MEPPKPKTPMIAVCGKNCANFIMITTASLDARHWIEIYGPQVGEFAPSYLQTGGILMKFELWVSEVFDADEVCAYINAMADSFR